ncbi:MAG: DotU family type IV/VI secretion system protein [Alphaproteobacteria bacterium]|nr:DotU family type IV/VI secretion system protein [Alphaproteobacteria bacterium]
MSFNASGSAVVHCFQAFYYELLRQKERALSLYVSGNNKISDSKYNQELEGLIVTIQKKLISTIETVNNTLVEQSRLPSNNIRDVKYIITVLSDETFINLNWEGTEIWKLYLLEKKLFKTEIAGDKFFNMADNALNDLNNEEMAFIYLVALSLGFKGKYRDVENADEYLNWYKNKLYAIIHFNKEKLFYPGRQHLINSCYEYTCTEGTNKVLPDANYLIFTIISIIMLYILISYIIWFNITGDINTTMLYMDKQVHSKSVV